MSGSIFFYEVFTVYFMREILLEIPHKTFGENMRRTP